MEQLKIVYLPPESLTPYGNNARRHQEEDLDAIRSSIERFGFRDPIGIWGKKNIIVEGHGRRQAAIAMGIKEVPCIRLDDMTDAERKAYALAHNKTAELSSWDFGKLKLELDGLSDFGMSAFGFVTPGESFMAPVPEEESEAEPVNEYDDEGFEEYQDPLS